MPGGGADGAGLVSWVSVFQDDEKVLAADIEEVGQSNWL